MCNGGGYGIAMSVTGGSVSVMKGCASRAIAYDRLYRLSFGTCPVAPVSKLYRARLRLPGLAAGLGERPTRPAMDVEPYGTVDLSAPDVDDLDKHDVWSDWAGAVTARRALEAALKAERMA
jgi:hypothetical protein